MNEPISDYRSLLHQRIAERKKSGAFVLRRVAEKIGVQYTFLSRALRHPSAHLNERHLFALCEELNFLPEEIDEIFLRRDHDLTQHPGRRAAIARKLRSKDRSKGVNAEVQGFDHRRLVDESQFLLDPFGMVVFTLLQVPHSRKSPRWIASALGISLIHLRNILRQLDRLGILELERDGETIRSMLKQRIHFPADHPFMRVHQARLREISGTYFEKAGEEQRTRFMVSFTADEPARRKIGERFNEFLKEVEQIARRAGDEKVYQLNFELFPWLG